MHIFCRKSVVCFSRVFNNQGHSRICAFIVFKPKNILKIYRTFTTPHSAINTLIPQCDDSRHCPRRVVGIPSPQQLREFLPHYSKIRIDIVVENRWSDIVKEGFNIGIQPDNKVGKEMIAI